ncbi:hypothetical protein MPTK1_7g17900 [Marchantia polymorpha subsp. ruderalis]|uniref:Pectinesterase inhibitor domain-containing protein n=2 Tax=Marchantia polymorpha TaxID=3197 RepID=A0AAF6C0X0_MARPO|nr:hypothetical protein MARPO_0102s0050 [Marchantia polymorpha]BBN17904.1 hypothetical protein Mp_7g17900 [Marchantia polymorpha subsp. ruderalis]|eukprot:PTQ32186.1 hypothetical protein MARPO_0102s0050 [Marchantia polymorpha]
MLLILTTHGLAFLTTQAQASACVGPVRTSISHISQSLLFVPLKYFDTDQILDSHLPWIARTPRQAVHRVSNCETALTDRDQSIMGDGMASKRHKIKACANQILDSHPPWIAQHDKKCTR